MNDLWWLVLSELFLVLWVKMFLNFLCEMMVFFF